MKAIQDLYPDAFAHCYGCGRLNEHGLHVRSHWLGDRAVARFTPEPYHIAMPGYIYGGLIASLIDCHSIGAAAAAAMAAAGRVPGRDPTPRYVTASLQVDFVRPTPAGVELELEAVPVEVGERKVIVQTTLSANGEVCARGRVVAVQIPKTFAAPEDG